MEYANDGKQSIYMVKNYNDVDLYLEGTGTIYDISGKIISNFNFQRSLVKTKDYQLINIYWSELQSTAVKARFSINWAGSDLSTNYLALKNTI